MSDCKNKPAKSCPLSMGTFGLGGALISGLWMIFSSYWLGGVANGYLVHILLGVVSMPLLIIILLPWLRGQTVPHCRSRSFMAAACILPALVAFAGLFYPSIVIAEAEAKAAGHPYCISLEKRRRAALSHQDLTFLTMDKNRDLHHAVLLVDRDGELEPYHWSYYAMGFVSGVYGWASKDRPSVSCHPEKDFAHNLPLINILGLKHHKAYLDGRWFIIPTSYYSWISGSYMSIDAVAPDFAPTPHEDSRLGPSMQFRDRTWLESAAEEILSANPTGKIGDLRQARIADGKTGYYRLDEKMRIESLIVCYGSRPDETACQHRFYREGRMFSFAHAEALLNRTSYMEQRLFDLFASFEIERPTASAALPH